MFNTTTKIMHVYLEISTFNEIYVNSKFSLEVFHKYYSSKQIFLSYSLETFNSKHIPFTNFSTPLNDLNF